MVVGRKPKPTHVRRREGNPGKRPLPVEIGTVNRVRELPSPPRTLGTAGKQAWSIVGQPLAEAGALHEAHLPILTLFAQAVELANDAFAQIHGGKFLRKGTKTASVIAPEFRVWESAVGKAVTLGEHLGASPVAMARLGLAALKGESLAQQLRARYPGGKDGSGAG